jgi:dCMP deaminase
MARPSWDEYFLDIMIAVGKRGTCDRGRSGSVIVLDERIVATGYVGSPPGQPHCDDVGHLMSRVVDENGNESMHCVRTVHAEENAILQSAKHGTSLIGSTLYCKMVPCFRCTRQIIAVGIKRVVAMKKYQTDGPSRELFKKAGIELCVIDDTEEQYIIASQSK